MNKWVNLKCNFWQVSVPNTDVTDGVCTGDQPRHDSWHCRLVYWTVTSDLPSLKVYSNIDELDLCENMALQPRTQTTPTNITLTHILPSPLCSQSWQPHNPHLPNTPPASKAKGGETNNTCAHASSSPPWLHTVTWCTSFLSDSDQESLLQSGCSSTFEALLHSVNRSEHSLTHQWTPSRPTELRGFQLSVL